MLCNKKCNKKKSQDKNTDNKVKTFSSNSSKKKRKCRPCVIGGLIVWAILIYGLVKVAEGLIVVVQKYI